MTQEHTNEANVDVSDRRSFQWYVKHPSAGLGSAARRLRNPLSGGWTPQRFIEKESLLFQCPLQISW